MSGKKISDVIAGKVQINKKDELLFLHLEEIYHDTKYISSLIDNIFSRKRISADRLHTILVELRVSARHLRDHLNEFQRPNESILMKLDNIVKKEDFSK